MPKPRPLTPLQAFTTPLAIAQDHGIAVSLEPEDIRRCAEPHLRLLGGTD